MKKGIIKSKEWRGKAKKVCNKILFSFKRTSFSAGSASVRSDGYSPVSRGDSGQEAVGRLKA